MPLYKQIAEAARSGSGKKVVVVMPEPSDEARTYLHSFGVDISEVYSVPLSSIPVRGTPTLLLLSGNGIVKRAWFGQQPTGQNARIVHEIFGGA